MVCRSRIHLMGTSGGEPTIDGVWIKWPKVFEQLGVLIAASSMMASIYYLRRFSRLVNRDRPYIDGWVARRSTWARGIAERIGGVQSMRVWAHEVVRGAARGDLRTWVSGSIRMVRS
ncbi:hypothetical protein V6N13_075578 [Hibiscus sabdariffa]|uniref:Uncharacterized protein n=1 Tax=Hibiscus sabdariffa TaxID=183260 RepID=A0ABR2UBZ9_9ROSI